MTQEELEFRRRCPYDAFGDYSDVLKEIRQKEKENKENGVKRNAVTEILKYALNKIEKNYDEDGKKR